MATPSAEGLAFGQAVRQLRLDRQLSQEALGYKAGVHRNYVGLVERGERNPSLDSIFRFARGIGVNASELIQLTEAMLETPRRPG